MPAPIICVSQAHHQATQTLSRSASAPGLNLYGGDAEAVLALPGSERELTAGLTEAMVRFALRNAYARTVEDVLARRSRLLFLDAAKTSEIANEVRQIIRGELGSEFDRASSANAFCSLAKTYLLDH